MSVVADGWKEVEAGLRAEIRNPYPEMIAAQKRMYFLGAFAVFEAITRASLEGGREQASERVACLLSGVQEDFQGLMREIDGS